MYEKLRADGCHCLCTYTHADSPGVCQTVALHDVIATLFSQPITIPMCRPCADAYQTHHMKGAFDAANQT